MSTRSQIRRAQRKERIARLAAAPAPPTGETAAANTTPAAPSPVPQTPGQEALQRFNEGYGLRPQHEIALERQAVKNGYNIGVEYKRAMVTRYLTIALDKDRPTEHSLAAGRILFWMDQQDFREFTYFDSRDRPTQINLQGMIDHRVHQLTDEQLDSILNLAVASGVTVDGSAFSPAREAQPLGLPKPPRVPASGLAGAGTGNGVQR